MIETARLLLLPPEARHIPALKRILSDPEVMAQLVQNPTEASADASLARHDAYREAQALGFWVVELEGEVSGLCGLKPGAPDTPIEGELEIGWIFDKPYWGKGLAGEAARAAIDWAWVNRAEPRIVAITSASHADSRKLMERLGMRHLPELDFAHPLYADDNPMRHSVVYAIDRPA